MSEPANLFGVPGAECFHDDPATVYERDIEPWFDPAEPRVIEEWTSRYATDGVTSARWIVDEIAERYAEADMAPDDDGGSADHIATSPAVLAAAEALVAAAKGVITYRWTTDLAATHEITWDDEEQPLLDGQPLYTDARPKPWTCNRCKGHYWLPVEHVGLTVRGCALCGHISSHAAAAAS